MVGSAALHGLLLFLPWPFEEPPKVIEPPPSESEETAVLDVTILPGDLLTSIAEEDPVGAEAGSAVEEEPQTEESPPAFTEEPPPPDPEPPEPLSTQIPELDSDVLEQPPPEEETGPVPSDELPPESGTTPPTGPPPNVPPLQDALALAVSNSSHNGAKRLDEDDGQDRDSALIDWYGEDQARFAYYPPDEAASIEVEYPLNVCKDPAPTPGYLIVVVDVNGEVLEGPDVFGSTGYDPLDNAAKQKVVETRDFGAEGEVKAYWLKVEVVGYPDGCS